MTIRETTFQEFAPIFKQHLKNNSVMDWVYFYQKYRVRFYDEDDGYKWRRHRDWRGHFVKTVSENTINIQNCTFDLDRPILAIKGVNFQFVAMGSTKLYEECNAVWTHKNLDIIVVIEE